MSSSNTVSQTALCLTCIGRPLVWSQQPIPRPGPGEILVRVHAVGLLPLDRKLRDLGVFNISSRLPITLGIDVVGEVVQHGPRPSTTQVRASYPAVGTKVLFQANLRRPHAGGQASFVLANAECLIPVPETISVVEAATLVTNPFTAALSLFHQFGLDFPFPGTDPTFDYHSAHVVVLGAGTTVGSLIVRLASIAGIGTIITTSSESSFASLRALVATHVIDRSSSSIAATVQSILGASIINVVEAYASGQPTLAVSLFEVSGVSGSIIMLASSTGADTAALADKGISLRNVNGSFESHPVLFQQRATVLPKVVDRRHDCVPPQSYARSQPPSRQRRTG
ncbi:hypothetical protein CGLO_08698 [Colletotrichum gloeosporioides Cg-14]|uniref:Alcohol dehydrogenase-like N-terminal domain-containing protein n=1 Tax=Colletotrichum gloeosporioides (strain Cg-14) TaxID=1237896 RepID=T0LTZ4_COLGC|nr:hypothetical protein CGLO_08698 [Colletotrichum gloeosporioides Cg-14]